MEERWRPVTTHDGYYEVSDIGRVRSVDRTETVVSAIRGVYQRTWRGRVLVPTLNDGYPQYSLWKAHKLRIARSHILVLEAFVGPRPAGLYGCHGDDDRQNNRLGNLYWGTPKQNSDDKIANGHHLQGTDIPWAKLGEGDVETIRALRGKVRQADLAARYGVVQSQISRIQLNRQWQHLPAEGSAA